MSTQIPRDFFAQDTLQVARQVLGTRLVHNENGQRISGLITETEAYRGREDLGCHARAGITPRTRLMFGPPGYTYVYFTYGMHWLLNFVTEAEAFPAAILIRGMLIDEGIDLVALRRTPQPPRHWTDGPARLCKALNIHAPHNGLDACAPGAQIFLEYGTSVPDSAVTTGPRVGLYSVPEPWKSIPWRFVWKQLPGEA